MKTLPVTNSSAVIELPSADLLPRTLNWSPDRISATVLACASANRTESPEYRRTIVVGVTITVSVLQSISRQRTFPPAASTERTIPPAALSPGRTLCRMTAGQSPATFIRMTRTAVHRVGTVAPPSP